MKGQCNISRLPGECCEARIPLCHARSLGDVWAALWTMPFLASRYRCWLRLDTYFIWSFIGPATLIIMVSGLSIIPLRAPLGQNCCPTTLKDHQTLLPNTWEQPAWCAVNRSLPEWHVHSSGLIFRVVASLPSALWTHTSSTQSPVSQLGGNLCFFNSLYKWFGSPEILMVLYCSSRSVVFSFLFSLW